VAKNYTRTKVEVPGNTLKILSPGYDEGYNFYVQSVNDRGPGPEAKIYFAKSGRESKSLILRFIF